MHLKVRERNFKVMTPERNRVVIVKNNFQSSNFPRPHQKLEAHTNNSQQNNSKSNHVIQNEIQGR